MEGTSEMMIRLVQLLARSRVLELEVIDKQLGSMLRPEFLKKIRADLEELARVTENPQR